MMGTEIANVMGKTNTATLFSEQTPFTPKACIFAALKSRTPLQHVIQKFAGSSNVSFMNVSACKSLHNASMFSAPAESICGPPPGILASPANKDKNFSSLSLHTDTVIQPVEKRPASNVSVVNPQPVASSVPQVPEAHKLRQVSLVPCASLGCALLSESTITSSPAAAPLSAVKSSNSIPVGCNSVIAVELNGGRCPADVNSDDDRQSSTDASCRQTHSDDTFVQPTVLPKKKQTSLLKNLSIQSDPSVPSTFCSNSSTSAASILDDTAADEHVLQYHSECGRSPRQLTKRRLPHKFDAVYEECQSRSSSVGMCNKGFSSADESTDEFLSPKRPVTLEKGSKKLENESCSSSYHHDFDTANVVTDQNCPKSQTPNKLNATKGRLDKTTSNSLSVSKASCKVDDYLERWCLMLVRDGVVCVKGYRNGSRRLHRTKAVVKRHSPYVIETASGSRYKLVGNQQLENCSGPTLPDEVLCQFAHGFPWNWQELLQLASEQTKTSAATGRSRSVEQKSTKAEKAESCTSSSLKTLANKTFLIPDEPISKDDLPRSRRSGRLLVPPLAYWSCQRIVTSTRACSDVALVQGQENVLTPTQVRFQESTEEPLVRHRQLNRSKQSQRHNRTLSKKEVKCYAKEEKTKNNKTTDVTVRPIKDGQLKSRFESLNKHIAASLDSSTLEVGVLTDWSDVEPDSQNYFSDED